jgi:hypothetical protein
MWGVHVGGPCSSQHDKCQVGNMHISLGDFSSFPIIPSSFSPSLHSPHHTTMFPSPVPIQWKYLELWETSNLGNWMKRWVVRPVSY